MMSEIQVACRVDSSPHIGEGHFRRCLLLANQCATKGVHFEFFCRELTPNNSRQLEQSSFRLTWLPETTSRQQDADALLHILRQRKSVPNLLLVDSYLLDGKWEEIFHNLIPSVVVLDDLADRPHHCTTLIDPSPLRVKTDYLHLVPPGTRLLLGADYTLLQNNFAAYHQVFRDGRQEKKQNLIHLFFGATDPANHTFVYAKLLLENLADVTVKVAAGPDYPFAETLAALHLEYEKRLQYTIGVDDMAAHMAECQLAIGAPGTATWERICLGIPQLLLATNDNQINILQRLHNAKFCHYLGKADSCSPHSILEVTNRLLTDENQRRKLLINCPKIDGKGASRVVHALLEDCRSS